VLILIGIVLLLVLPAPWNVIAFAVAIVLGAVEVFIIQRRVRNIRHPVGADVLIGAVATVVERCDPGGEVKVEGQLWQASCAAGAEVGDRVRVVARHRLTLTVEREQHHGTSSGAGMAS